MKPLFILILASSIFFGFGSYAQLSMQEITMQPNLEQDNKAPTLADASPKNYHWLKLTNPIPSAKHYPNNLQYTPSKSNKIVYFDAYWGVSDIPVKDGYYRKILGKTATGHTIVQDFFQSNHAIQSSPMVLGDNDIYALGSSGLTYNFHQNGALQHIFYSADNHVSEKVYVKNQKYIARSVFNGKDNLAHEKLYLLDDKQQIYAYTYLPDNQNTFIIALFYPNQSMKYWKNIDLNSKVTSEKAWDIHGKKVQPTQAMRLDSILATKQTKDIYLLDIMDSVIDFMENSEH